MDSSSLLALFAILIAVVVAGLLITGVVLMIRDTRRQRGGWGINLSIPNCRHCGERMPAVRVPANLRQAIWGGWTCAQCGLEVDKWGEPVPGQNQPAKWSAKLDDRNAPTRSPDERYKTSSEEMKRGGDIRG
jgi:hypothetical protein